MEQLFVSCEIAKKLKEKGFNEPCIATFYPDKTVHVGYIGDTNTDIEPYTQLCSAPTYQQVVDWFREKKQVYISVKESFAFDNSLAYVVTLNGRHVNHGIFDKPVNRFDSYYEALDKAIIEALNLI